MSSESSSVATLKKQIDAIAEMNVESSQNASDLLADINLLSPKSPNSSPTSPNNESDDHLLDFLDDSQLCEETPKAKKYEKSLSPQESSYLYTLSTSSSPHSGNNDQESDTNTFITAFNTKYDLAACSLFDVLDLIDSMLIKSSKPKNQEDQRLNNKNEGGQLSHMNQLTTNNNKLIAENTTLRSRLDDATNSMKDAQSLITTLEQKIANLKSSNEALQNSNNSLQNDLSNLHQSLNSMHSIMENQLEDLSLIGSQRIQLIEITKKQDLIMQQYDQICRSAAYTQKLQNSQPTKIKNEKTIEPPKAKKYAEDEFYNLMCSSIRAIDESQLSQEISNTIYSIRDNSQLPLTERILQMVKSLSIAVSSANENAETLKKQNNKAVESQAVLHKKCGEILTLFEEELNFLQNLSHSTDLQTIIFNHGKGNSSHILTDEAKSELIKRCALLGRFVEETIGVISQEKFEESFEVPDGIEGTHIFELLQTTQMTEKLSVILGGIDKDNIAAREIFDMFTAQVFMNGLLKNHANELLLRISHCSREISNLRQEVNEQSADQEQTETMKKLLKHFRHRDSKLRRYLSKYIELPQDAPTNEAVISLIENIGEKSAMNTPLAQENEQLKVEIQKLDKELRGFKEEKNKKSSNKMKNEQLLAQAKSLQSQLDESRLKLKESNSQITAKLEEIENMKSLICERDQKINEFTTQIESAEQSHQNAMREANERINFSISENKRLKQQIGNFENAMTRVKKNRQQLGHEIERLKRINLQLTESIDAQRNKMKNEYMSSIRELTDVNEKSTRDISSLQSQVQILTAKNQQLISENATLNISKKSSDLKLRSIEERLNLEKRNIQSQIAAQVNATQVGQSKKVNDMISQIDNAIDRLAAISNEERSSTLDQAISNIEEELIKARKSQYHYVQLLDITKEAEKILNIQTPEKLVEAIHSILSKQSNNDRISSDNEKKAKNERLELEKLRRDSKKSEGQVVQLKQWENWAKRIHRIVHEAEYVHLNSEQLRQSLEEALLASVSSRSIFMRVESLRTQKNLLEKYDRRVLFTKQIPRNSLRPVIAICLCIRRMQKFAGCLPLSIATAEIQPVLKPHSAKKDRITPRKKKTPKRGSQKERNACKSPLRPLIPMFI